MYGVRSIVTCLESRRTVDWTPFMGQLRYHRRNMQIISTSFWMTVFSLLASLIETKLYGVHCTSIYSDG
jgi:hypothetical protein